MSDDLKARQERLKLQYLEVFTSQSGKAVLEDLKNMLCINSDFLTTDYSKELAHHLQAGMRLAYLYIENCTSSSN